MNIAEKILVVCDIETSYNLCPGGNGGFRYINSHKDSKLWKINNARKSNGPITETGKNKQIESSIKGGFISRDMKVGIHSKDFINVGGGFTGKKHSNETIIKMSKAKIGVSTWNKGIPRSEETKRKISESINNTIKLKRGGEVVTRHPHKLEITGAIPVCATI